jgi:adenylate kinase family enzyme
VILGPGDRLPQRPSRIVVAGTSGSGKTTLSAAIAAVLDLEHVEIDALFHGPDWTPREAFELDVATFIERPSWVTEWTYGLVRDRVADRADLVIWLDLPRHMVMRQVIERTLRRRCQREVLWNGNIEPPIHRIVLDKDHIVRWAWKTHHQTAVRIDRLIERRPELNVVRLRSRSEVNQWASGSLVDVRERWGGY